LIVFSLYGCKVVVKPKSVIV